MTTPLDVEALRTPKTITFRLAPELRQQLEAEIAALEPYAPSITAVVERGLVLALVEMAERRARNARRER